MTRTNRLALAHIGVAVGAFGVAAAMAMMQALSRANLDLPFRSARMYYLSVTAHGVLMAIVFTTFFIMGLGYAVAARSLDRPLPWQRLGWSSFWVATAGAVAAAAVILAGKASVLYTFYPPLKAHPAFYIGATLLVVGSWGWCAVMIRALAEWRAGNREAPIPLAMFGIMATVIVWILATIGVAAEMLLQLIPWSLGITDRVDPVLARTLFWWFGHPLVYFWLLPAYMLWYAVIPRQAGGKLFSEPLAKLVFVLFILLSTPVGFHHQFMDPGIPAGWKLFHTFNTMWILFPSFITAFTVIASLEIAGRARGGEGLLGWIRKLPWNDPFVTATVFAMLLFAIGGFGGAINASYSMNAMVHNTSWVPGHFHTTVGSAVALTFMGASYWLVPILTGRDLELRPLARVQPWLWFVGMLLFSVPTHITGLMGMPRRVYDTSYGGDPTAASWEFLTALSAIGGIVLFASAVFYCLVMLFTVTSGRSAAHAGTIEFAEPLEAPGNASRFFDRLWLWTALAVVLIVLAYAYPIWHHLQTTRYGSPGFSPF
ncbi:MAG TPA: b(o/a)3-type cytochrome-c oxidase subunit 1 [Gemmatimonadales bacterium]|nr:b(o/a)3-type cytochrome-c oxidase subunit 1 [Gemmatimonadales bacterium]